MTPRSRKPVIIGAMRDMTADNYHNNFIGFQIREEDNVAEHEANISHINVSLQRSKSESSLIIPTTPSESKTKNHENDAQRITKATSDETLSTPFR